MLDNTFLVSAGFSFFFDANNPDPGLALVAQLQSQPVPQGWTLLPQGDATLLRNDGEPKSRQLAIYPPVPAGDLKRRARLAVQRNGDRRGYCGSAHQQAKAQRGG